MNTNLGAFKWPFPARRSRFMFEHLRIGFMSAKNFQFLQLVATAVISMRPNFHTEEFSRFAAFASLLNRNSSLASSETDLIVNRKFHVGMELKLKT